jgi:hypothetical protein
MKEIELKIAQVEKRDDQHFSELKSRTIGLFAKLDDNQQRREQSDVEIKQEVLSFEKQVQLRLSKNKMVRPPSVDCVGAQGSISHAYERA